MSTPIEPKKISVGMSFGSYDSVNENYNYKYKKQTKENHITGLNFSRTEEYYNESGEKLAWGRQSQFYNHRNKETTYECIFKTENLYYSGTTNNLKRNGIFTKIESSYQYALDINNNGVVDDNEIFNK